MTKIRTRIQIVQYVSLCGSMKLDGYLIDLFFLVYYIY